MAPNSAAIGTRLILDTIVLVLVAVPVIVYKFAVNIKPAQRGFFCDDDSIKYPYHASTVTTPVLIIVSLFLNIFFFIVCEIVNYRISLNTNPLPAIKVFSFPVNRCLYSIVGLTWGLSFGMMATQALTDIGKNTVGRLRPHFIQACELSPDYETLCADSNTGYVTNYTCGQADSEIYQDLRRSFPSGHASMSAYAMVFLAYYIQQRVPRLTVTYLLKSLLQVVVIALAWYCALSRVTDYKHHPTDVLAGSFLGTVVGLLIGRYVMKSFKNPYENEHFRSRGFGTADSMELGGLNDKRNNLQG